MAFFAIVGLVHNERRAQQQAAPSPALAERAEATTATAGLGRA